MKVLLVTQWYDPEPTLKGLSFAKALRDEGHEVQVITGFPNYPGGKIYSGYTISALKREWIDGIEIYRVALYPSHDGSGIRRAMNYISFAASSCLFGLFATRKADVIYAYHPPLTVGLSAALIGLFRRIPIVYDIQDMWPDTLGATGMLNSTRALSIIGRVCQWVYQRASKIVVLSPGFRDLLISRGVPEEKIRVIYNWSDAGALQAPVVRAQVYLDKEKFNVVFAGTMGKAQALEAVIEAATIVAQKAVNVQFVFVGGGIEVETLKSLAAQRASHNIDFIPRMPMEEIGAVLAAADVLLVHLRDDPLFGITVPSKTQAYMAAGRPILMAVRGDAADLVRKAECGVVARPESPQDIARAVLELCAMPRERLDAMGVSGSKYYDEHLSMSAGVNKFAEVFAEAVHLYRGKNA